MVFKLIFEKSPDLPPAPSVRMDKIRVERKVAFVETLGPHLCGVGRVDRHIEDRKVQIVDCFAMTHHKIESAPR